MSKNIISDKLIFDFGSVVYLEEGQRMQDRLKMEALNLFPLEYVSGNTSSFGSLLALSDFKPYYQLAWGRKEINVIGNFKTLAKLEKDDALLTGFPVVHKDWNMPSILSYVESYDDNGTTKYRMRTKSCKLRNRKCKFMFYAKDMAALQALTDVSDGAKYFVDTAGKAYVRSSGAWEEFVGDEGDVYFLTRENTFRKVKNGKWIPWYECIGELRLRNPKQDGPTEEDATTIPAGTSVNINNGPYSTLGLQGGALFPRITNLDVKRACEWIRQHRGMYDYGNNRRVRFVPVDKGDTVYDSVSDTDVQKYGITDCSAMIHQAFRYGAGKFVPSAAVAQPAFGRVVAYARAGEKLDLSNVKEGDVVGFLRANDQLRKKYYKNGEIFYDSGDAGVSSTWAAFTRLGSSHHVAIFVKGLAEDPTDTKLRMWHMSTSFGAYERTSEGATPTLREDFEPFYHYRVVDENDWPKTQPVSSGTQRVFGPNIVAGMYKDGTVVTDADFRMSTDARIVVRWSEADDDYVDDYDTSVPTEDDGQDDGGEGGTDN